MANIFGKKDAIDNWVMALHARFPTIPQNDMLYAAS